MQKRILGLVATTALTGGLVLTGIGPASAAHYCKVTPSVVHQTNARRTGRQRRLEELERRHRERRGGRRPLRRPGRRAPHVEQALSSGRA